MLLIVENDTAFAQLLLDAAREKGFKGIVTSSGVSALALAVEYTPSAVTLDIFLPDIDGWRVLDRLKNDDLTRHIPVTVISTDEARERALKSGAFQFAAKPMQSKEVVDGLLDALRCLPATLAPASACRVGRREQARVVRADARGQRRQGHGGRRLRGGVRGDCARAGRLRRVRRRARGAAGRRSTCTKVTASRRRTARRSCCTARARTSTSSTTGVRSPSAPACAKCGLAERLLEQASFCLHRDLASMPDAHRTALKDLRDANEVLQGKTVMIVDDDMRNIFALTSLLEDRGMVIVSHDNGRDAVTALHAQPDVEAILMDIMMPEMDGIDTIREIRQIPACRDTPIIAVTAKAMKGDREKCMEAGAWDYLSKPVDTELMLGCLRGWLSR